MINVEFTTTPDLAEMARRAGKSQDEIVGYLRQVMARQAVRFRAMGYEAAPKRTGQYAGSIETQPITGANEAGFKALSAAPLGTFIQKGTRPHVIRARNARFLVFYRPKTGWVMFLKSVNHINLLSNYLSQFVIHPGTAANPFIERTLNAWLPGIQSDLRAIPAKWVESVTT